MTPEQLRALPGFGEMCTSEQFRHLLAHFAENCPFVSGAAADATETIRNEGRMSGWFRLLKAMRAIHRTNAEPEKATTKQLYEDPDERNRKKTP